MTLEQRSYQALEVRMDGENPRRFEADVLTYGVLDSYNTIFDRGVFDASLADTLPRITWGHDWTDPIGRYVDWKNTDTRDDHHGTLRLIGELDDFQAVPRAYQASAQLASGTINQFSVGFHRVPDGTYKDDDGIEHFRSAGLDEVALVLVGAVPGTKLVSVRSGPGVRQIPEELVIDLAKAVANGTLTKAAALIAVDLAAGTGLGMVPDSPGDVEGSGDTVGILSPEPSDDADVTAAEAILEEMGL